MNITFDPNNIAAALLQLASQSVQVRKSNYYGETITDNAAVEVAFSGGANLRAVYWRLIKAGRSHISSFDHHQQYGLPEPIDAIEVLAKEVEHQTLAEAHLNKETGDIYLICRNGAMLQIFNFTGYEVWRFTFPDGFEAYSNQLYRKA